MLLHLLWTRVVPRRAFSSCSRVCNNNLPFQDDLTPFDNDAFGLGDFQSYVESEEVKQHRLATQMVAQGVENTANLPPQHDTALETANIQQDFAVLAEIKEPLVVTSQLSDPYLNLAIEDYIYNKMPFRDAKKHTTYNRMMLYVNSPCVVIGKNQNPWKEVNLPLLHSLYIPLVRRKSGGGTVVHDSGNVNFSFMTSKQDFDRFKFAHVVTDAVNSSGKCLKKLKVNARGDIVTEATNDKVSGSAYKLSRGKSYHHGTMLLTLKLSVLGQLLHRDTDKLGVVDAKSSISSVRSPVTNIELTNPVFMDIVSSAFKNEELRALSVSEDPTNENADVNEFNEMFNLSDFANSAVVSIRTLVIDHETKLPQEILDEAELLKKWTWRFGHTPQFTHTLTSPDFNFSLRFDVDKHAVVSGMGLEFFDPESDSTLVTREDIVSSFSFLEQAIKNNGQLPLEDKLKYTGSAVAGFITNDVISDWVGECIDGTI